MKNNFGSAQNMRDFSEEKLAPEARNQRNAGFTLVELLVVTGILSLVAFLVYPAYLGSSRAYTLGDVKTNLQQNTRLAMKRMAAYLEGGMVVIPEDSNEATDPDGNNYGYDESLPNRTAFYVWNSSPESSDNDKIAFYAALPSLDTDPINPASTLVGQKSLLYMRRYLAASSSWEDPLPLVRPEIKVTQLNFILGGDNKDKVLITLELAQEGPTQDEWRSYKLVSAAKLGAR